MFLFIRDIANRDLIGWIDARLRAAGDPTALDRITRMREAVLEPLRNVYGVSDKVLAMVREIRPDIVVLHGTWEKYLDHVAETVVALKQQTSARVVVLGAVPAWRRGLPSEVIRYFMLHHRLIPPRSTDAMSSDLYDAVMRAKLVPLGAEFVSASDALCNEDGCLTRIGDTAADISASDQVHLTEKGSEFLIDSIINRLLGGQAPASKPQ